MMVVKDFPGSTENKSRRSLQNGGQMIQSQIWNSTELIIPGSAEKRLVER
jgi:hypothetical protein